MAICDCRQEYKAYYLHIFLTNYFTKFQLNAARISEIQLFNLSENFEK